MRRIIQNPLHWLLLCLTLTPVLLVGLYVHSFALAVPFADQWDLSLFIAIATENGTLTAADITQNYVGHRVVFTNLLTALTTLGAGWSPKLEAYVTILIGLMNLGLLAALFHHQAPKLTRWYVIPAAWLVFHLFATDTWLFSASNGWLFVVLFLLLGLNILQKAAPGPRAWLGVTLCAIAATYSFGSGMVVWFVLGPLLVWWGYRWWVAPFGLIGVGIIYAYLAEILAQEVGDNAENSLEIPAFIGFVLANLGSPFSISGYWVPLAIIMGLVGVVGLAANVVYLWRSGFDLRQLGLWLGLAAFAVGSVLTIAITRLNPDDLTNATAGRYAQASLPFWHAFAATTFLVWRQHGAARPNMPALSLYIAPLLVPFYLQATLLTITSMAQQSGYPLVMSEDIVSASEECVASFPLQRDAGCLAEFPLGGGTSPQHVYYLAAYDLTVFRDAPPVSILPATDLDARVILETPSVWLNSYLRDSLLAGVDEARVFHLAPDVGDDFPAPLPQPLTHTARDLSSRDPLADFLDGQPEVWHIITPDTTSQSPDVADTLSALGYAGSPVPIRLEEYREARLSLVRYRTLPEVAASVYEFPPFTLYAWDTDLTASPAPCQSFLVRSWWQAERVPQANHILTAVLVDAEGRIAAHADDNLAGLETQLWQPDRFYLDVRALRIGCDVPPGAYDLLLGVYDPDAGEDVPARLPDGATVGPRAYLTTITLE